MGFGYAQTAGRPSEIGGSGEIRTHGWLAPSPVFKTGALNRSATLPCKSGAHCSGFGLVCTRGRQSGQAGGHPHMGGIDVASTASVGFSFIRQGSDIGGCRKSE
jgi:hypothetical protein